MRRTEQRDGFTLIEVTISVLILGMIMAVLGLATVTVIKSTPVSQKGVDDVRSFRALNMYLAQDALSTPARLADTLDPGGFDVDPLAPGRCPGPAGMQNVVQMVWADASSGVFYAASYRFEPDGDESMVYRITCSGPDPDNLANAAIDRLAQGLGPSVPTSEYDGPSNELRVAFTSATGLTITVEVASRNPGTP